MKFLIACILFVATSQFSCAEPLKFDYKNCGPITDPLFLTNFTISPEPVKIPGLTNTFIYR